MAFTKTKTNYNKMVFRVPRTVWFFDSETKKFETVEFNMVIWNEKDNISVFVKAEVIISNRSHKYLHLLQEIAISSTKAVQEYLIPALLDTKTPEVFIAKAEPSSEIFAQFSDSEFDEIINQLELMRLGNDEINYPSPKKVGACGRHELG